MNFTNFTGMRTSRPIVYCYVHYRFIAAIIERQRHNGVVLL